MTGNVGKRIAWSERVTFDGKHKKIPEQYESLIAYKKNSEEKGWKDNGIHWDMDVQPLISSSKWLQLHGLKRNKLSFSQILSQIGFQHKEDYVSILGKLVASRYSNRLYRQYTKAQDGKRYNLTAKKDLLIHFVNCLAVAIELYKQRMEWLTTESRQIFGVIQEQSIAIVLDFGISSAAEFNLCCEALCMVLTQQVAQIAKFNLIRVTEDLVKWQENAVPVTECSIKAAVEWLCMLDHLPAVCHTGPIEAILEAVCDDTVEAVYYFVVGDLPECMKHLVLQKISQSPCPVHTVTFNAREEETITFLKELSHLTSGRFHAFAERTDCIDMTEMSVNWNEDKKSVPIQNSRKLKGKLPLGAGVREDVFLIWKELEEARTTQLQVQRILTEFEESESTKVTKTDYSACDVQDSASSKRWLQKNGLKAQKLTVTEALGNSTFRHADGVVDIKTKPENEYLQTDAETNKKRIHAKYCDKFIHMHLEDGTTVHVHLDAEKYLRYEDRMKNALDQMESRLQELRKGSRALFGDVVEDYIYILIDTSHSMKNKLPLVKEKIFQLVREQLQNKTQFNLVKFDGEAIAWKEKLAEVNEHNLKDALLWIKGLKVGSSTNTLKALQIAFDDSKTQAIYLLTDGRPDQPPQTILDQLKLQRNIPIHTISFNCDDTRANKFLHELANETGGRFHYYHICLMDPDAPKPFEAKDIYLLKKEIEQGEKELKKVNAFYTDNVWMDWFNGSKHWEHKHRRQAFTASSVSTQVEGLNPPPPDRPYCASEEPASASPQPVTDGRQTHSESPTRKKKALYAEQTRSSMLRTLRYATKSFESSPNGRPSPERKELKTQKPEKKKNIDPLDLSSVQWLRTHGLVARRLTIMDALAPTAVPRTAKYIPILDKHVVSKVFDDVFPFAHVSNDMKCVTLINPQAVDLDAYKKKLQEAIKEYERRLDLIVWRALSQEEKDKYVQDHPVSYLENKESLLQALEQLNWPITYEDVKLLEDELLTGLSYIDQASELQEASKEEARRICPFHLCHSKEIQQKLQTRPQVKRKQKGKTFDSLRGRKVIARSESTGFYYPGTVLRSITSSYALIDFTSEETEIVPLKFILPVGGAMPCPSLQVGDYVLTRIRKQSGEEYYVPGIVIATPNKAAAEDKLYTVLKYNNRKEHCVRNGLIKISRKRYTCSCCYINMTQMMDQLMPNVKVVKHFHRALPAEEKEITTVTVGGDWKKKTKARKGRAKSKKEPCKGWASSDSDEMLFAPRKTAKRRAKSSSPSPSIKGSEAPAYGDSSAPFRPRRRSVWLSVKSSEDKLRNRLHCSRCLSEHQQSAPQLTSVAASSSSGSSNCSLSSIEKVEDLARRLQQYHIAQRKGRPPVVKKEQCQL
ncbi:von Willebrand factor A domain-containing protein 3B [Eublepharis macularius]|uniref:von Willebrand factor A domain-containing protein 3B n=1 Tax=Eublepharis macularius TaxID=481883 RepID=A0AA97J3T4_EUBMA|nr:von Willebrand factor A domain-containing protein 3B [Eublepharis macularius]